MFTKLQKVRDFFDKISFNKFYAFLFKLLYN